MLVKYRNPRRWGSAVVAIVRLNRPAALNRLATNLTREVHRLELIDAMLTESAVVMARPGGLSAWQHAGPSHIWMRDLRSLIYGVDLTPFTCAAMAEDMVNWLTLYRASSADYINADYTLSPSRRAYLGLAALTTSATTAWRPVSPPSSTSTARSAAAAD